MSRCNILDAVLADDELYPVDIDRNHEIDWVR